MASAAETTATAFKTMLGSGEAAGALIEKIKKLGAETPFEFPELANAGRMLLAFGESAADIPDTLRRIGDVSSAVAAPIGDIAEIYGKARTAGTLFSEDINQLTGRGIPIIREFAKILKQPESAIKKLAEEGKITFPLLDQAFRDLTSEGGQFFGMMEEQAKTSAGLWSTLSDAVGALYLRFGEPLNDAIKPILNDAIGLAGKLEPMIQRLGTHMAGALTAARNFVAESEQGGGVVEALGVKLKAALSEAADALMIPFRALGAGLPALGAGLMAVMRPAGEWMSAKLDSAALSFSALIMKGVRDALTALSESSFAASLIPGVSAAAKSLNGPAAMASNDALNAESRADRAAESMPGALATAGDMVAQGITQMKSKFATEVGRFVPPAAKDTSGLPMSPLDPNYNPLFPQGLPAAGPDTSGLPPSPLTAPAGMTPMPWELPNVGGGPPSPLAPQAGRPSMPWELPGAGMPLPRLSAPNLPPPNLPSPGLAKRDQERRETAATASRSSGGGHPLMAEIKDIAAKLNSLAVAS
jgi:hypothetical protein